MPTITVDKVSKYYYEKRPFGLKLKRYREIGVEDVNLTIEQGEFVFVIGSSGAGKSTLLELLGGRLKADRGSVRLNGKNLSKLKKRRRKQLPLRIGYVAEEDALDRKATIRENLLAAGKAGGKRLYSKTDMEERIDKVLGLTGLGGMKDHYPGQLSSGERRRAELARALIHSPPILVLDEVTSRHQDDVSTWDVFLLLDELNRRGTTVIMTSNHSGYVNMLRRRVVTLVDGRVFSDVDKGRYGEVAK